VEDFGIEGQEMLKKSTALIRYLDQTRSKIASENPGELTYWTLSAEGRGGSIPEDGKNRACAAY
jgi:hypothetical protein